MNVIRGEMIAKSREKYSKSKHGGGTGCLKFLKPSNSRQWSGLRNSRIVRVSRTFGGKDRHSKVCTIRGLRDRRIRLSVPTAIQLYDLQDRLGVGQPSKVIDWLLEVTKFDIDKLPPLQIPQGFGKFDPHPMVLAYESSASQPSLPPNFFDVNSAINTKDGVDHSLNAKSKYWDVGILKYKEDRRGSLSEKGKWTKSTDELENQNGVGGYRSQMSAQNFFYSTRQSPLPLLHNDLTYSSYHLVDPSNLSLSQFGSYGTLPSQSEELNNGNVVSFPSSLPVPFAGSQLFVCPSSASATVPPAFALCPPYISTSVNNDPRLFNHVQLLSSSSQVLPHSLMPSIYPNSPLKSFPSQLRTKLLGSEIQNQSQLYNDKSGS